MGDCEVMHTIVFHCPTDIDDGEMKWSFLAGTNVMRVYNPAEVSTSLARLTDTHGARIISCHDLLEGLSSELQGTGLPCLEGAK